MGDKGDRAIPARRVSAQPWRRRAVTVLAVGLAAMATLLGVGSAASAAAAPIAVADTGDSLVNGQDLIAAVSQAQGMNPSASNRVVINVAAGEFDIDQATIALPDGVDIVGAGRFATTVCHCAAHADQAISANSGTWFVSPGSNRVADLTLTEGLSLLVDNAGGDLVFDDVRVLMTGDPLDGSYSPRQLAEVSGGTFSFANSALSADVFKDSPKGIVATGSASVRIDNSTMEMSGFSTPLVVVESGDLSITGGSQLNGGSGDGTTGIRATGAAGISISDSTVSASGSDFGATTIWMQAGGSVDVVNSTLVAGQAGCCGTTASIKAVDATVTAAGSSLRGEVDLSGGAVHLSSTDITIDFWNPIAFTLDSTVGSMSGGSITHWGYEQPETADVLQGDGTIVFDGVAMRNSRLTNDPGAICIATSNDDLSVFNDLTSIIATQTPPLDCAAGAPQAGYPGGAHAVPGSIEAEDYDSAAVSGVSFADTETGNFKGAYRSDDVDIWPTVGEPGFTVGRTRGGEWLEYTFEVASAGFHDVAVRLATGFSDPGAVRVSIDGVVAGTIDDIPIDGWWNFSAISVGDVDLAAGEHVLRLDITGNGQINLDRIDIAAVDGRAVCTGLAQQGEAGYISGSMQASATAVGSVPGTSNKYSGVDGADYAEYCVIAQNAGVYELDTVVKAPSTTMDSFFVEVNGATPVTWHIAGPRSSSFVPRTVQVGSGPLQVTLDAGENIVRFYHRETGTELDSFELRPLNVACTGPLVQFADDGTPSGAMIAAERIESVAGTPNKYVFDGADYVEYCVSVAETGVYKLRAVVEAPDTASNSFYITVGSQGPVTWHIPIGSGSLLAVWDVRTGSQNPQQFILNEGGNVVRFYHRETGAKIDDFRFIELA